MQFEDMVKTAKKWVPIIQEKEHPDVLIGLFHSGVDYTYGNVTRDTPNNENASQLVAEQVPGFDLIFVGHDHSGWSGQGWDPAGKKKIDVKDPNGKVVGIYGPFANAGNVALVKMNLTWNDQTGTWDKSVRGGLVDMKTYQPDVEFQAKFQPMFNEIKAWVDRPISKMDGVITTRDSMFGD
jgi:2',3'-cyclic-nucleotide 2'-phosphodiesterase/3'-nucleotidase